MTNIRSDLVFFLAGLFVIISFLIRCSPAFGQDTPTADMLKNLQTQKAQLQQEYERASRLLDALLDAHGRMTNTEKTYRELQQKEQELKAKQEKEHK